MRRIARRVTRALGRAAFTAGLIALLAAPARADDPPALDVAGEWAVQGEHAELGRFAGTARFRRLGASEHASLYAYEAEIAYEATGRPERLRGRAEQRGAELLVTAESSRDFGGVSGALGGVAVPERSAGARLTRQACYTLPLGGDRAHGELLERSGDRVSAGVETMTAREPTGHALELYIDGHQFFPALSAAIGAARDHVNVQFYIVRDDATGRVFVDELIAAHRRGVKVRVLLDQFGADEIGELDDRLREAGVELIVGQGYGEGLVNLVSDGVRAAWNGLRGLFGFGPPPPRERRTLLNRDHRKLVVVDGQIAFVGGMNVGEEYEKRWHDMMLGIAGPVVRDLQRAFFDRWTVNGGELPPAEAMPRYFRRWTRPAGPFEGVNELVSIPGLTMQIRDAYLAEIGAARRHVLLENAYFLDEGVMDGLKAARARGVRVVAIIPADEHNDVGAVADAGFFVHNDLIRRGVELYAYRDRMVHAKVATIDGRWSTVGSANLDYVGLNLESELNVQVHDPRFAEVMEKRVFERDIRDSDRLPVRKVGFFEKAKKGFFHLFRNVL